MAEAILRLRPDPSALRVVLTGGDALSTAPPVGTPFKLVNHYGPTEVSVVTSAATVAAGEPGVPPIGYPIDGLHVYLLDGVDSVRDGLPGELCVAGAGLARGYLDRPGLTADRFVPDPAGPSGSRMYRTGDFAVRRHDGALEFRGRTDEQVEIRGFRVEPAEVTAALADHPDVDRSMAVARAGGTGDIRLVGYVVPVERPAGHDQVAEWGRLYDAVYAEDDPFAGWNSSYDGRPIPSQDMREWRDAVVDRIRELRPRRVLEIGVGTGLLLSELAPDCAAYWGTDLSAAVIDNLRRRYAGQPHLQLRHREAIDFSGLPQDFFDVVVINSVVQYFPDEQYLRTVLSGALDLVKSGGSVLVGDVRDLRQLRAFHDRVARHRADLTVQQSMRREFELLVSPEFFTSLPGPTGVDIRIKRGRAVNELTQFRYDVVLHTAPARVSDLGAAPEVAWAGREALAAVLHDGPDRVRVTKVPNGRLTDGVDPESIHDLGDAEGYRTIVTWSPDGDGGLEAVFHRETSAATAGAYRPANTPAPMVNAPRMMRPSTDLPASVRAHVAERLPEHLVPDVVVVLDALPLTANGKVDRDALPDPIETTPTEIVPPRDELEDLIARAWYRVLELPDRSTHVHDNFFALGGHSLQAIALAARLRDMLGIDMPIQVALQAPTIAELAAEVRLREPSAGQLETVLGYHQRVAQLSDEEVTHLLAELAGPRTATRRQC